MAIADLTQPMPQPSAGEVDNRLSLDPHDPRWPQVSKWTDGEEYILEMVRVRQLSSGEFEVVDMKPTKATGQMVRGQEMPLRQSPLRAISMTGRAGRPNPALEALLSANR